MKIKREIWQKCGNNSINKAYFGFNNTSTWYIFYCNRNINTTTLFGIIIELTN